MLAPRRRALSGDHDNADTYASQLLTTGVASIDWIAEQMGHSNANMIRQHYGTWIDEDGPDIIGMLEHDLNL